jgi:ABC-type dipeptide/oligopeptide/nickel transport system ATPase component
MIFQDPYASLNPRMRVADIVGEAPLVHGMTTRAGFDAYVDEQMRRAGLDPGFKRRYVRGTAPVKAEVKARGEGTALPVSARPSSRPLHRNRCFCRRKMGSVASTPRPSVAAR